jgi:hypothetical protein
MIGRLTCRHEAYIHNDGSLDALDLEWTEVNNETVFRMQEVRNGVSVIFALGTASGTEALEIVAGGSVSAVPVKTEVVTRYHQYRTITANLE